MLSEDFDFESGGVFTKIREGVYVAPYPCDDEAQMDKVDGWMETTFDSGPFTRHTSEEKGVHIHTGDSPFAIPIDDDTYVCLAVEDSQLSVAIGKYHEFSGESTDVLESEGETVDLSLMTEAEFKERLDRYVDDAYQMIVTMVESHQVPKGDAFFIFIHTLVGQYGYKALDVPREHTLFKMLKALSAFDKDAKRYMYDALEYLLSTYPNRRTQPELTREESHANALYQTLRIAGAYETGFYVMVIPGITPYVLEVKKSIFGGLTFYHNGQSLGQDYIEKMALPRGVDTSKCSATYLTTNEDGSLERVW